MTAEEHLKQLIGVTYADQLVQLAVLRAENDGLKVALERSKVELERVESKLASNGAEGPA